MAFLWKHPQSKYWVARFIDRDGKRRNRSTRVAAKEANRKQAQKIADTYEETANRRRTATHVRDTIAALHREITGEEFVSRTFRQFATSWLASKAAGTTPATLTFYRHAATKFTDFLGEKADSDLSEISRETIIQFRNREAETLSAKSVNHALKVLRMVFRAARRERVLVEDPSEFVEAIRQRSGSVRRPFSVPELKAVLGVADDEWRSMILFGLYSGQRLGDVASLTWANIDLTAGELRLVAKKTGRTIIQPLAGPLLAHVDSLDDSDDPSAPIHPRAYEAFAKTGKSAGLSNQFADLLAQAGLREKQAHRKTHGAGRGIGSSKGGLSFHALRHTAVSLLKDAGVPASVVMELVGHDSESMSQHYTHTGTASLKKAAEAFPSL